MIQGLLLQNFTNSIYGGILVAVVILIRLAVKKRVSKNCICFLWIPVALRLIIPFSYESSFGVLPQIPIGRISVSDTFEHFYCNEPMKPAVVDLDESLVSGVEDNMENAGTKEQDVIDQMPDTPTGNIGITIPVVVWLLGSVFMLGYMLAAWIATGRKVRFAVPETYHVRASLSDAYDVEIKAYSTEDIRVPFLYGLMKPKIYLPFGLSEEDRVHVIRHEMAHIRRYDHVTKPLFFVILAFYWYNPLVWLAFKLFSTDMEMACDEAVVDSYDAKTRDDYIHALLSVAGNKNDLRMLSLPFGNAPLKERISRVASYKRSGWGIKVASVIVIVMLSVLFSSVHATAGQGGIIITDYDLVIPVIDETNGERYLLIPYYKDQNTYEIVALNADLESEVKENTGQFWYDRPLSDYTIIENDAVGLDYIVENGDALWESHVLLQDDNDRKKYDLLAQDYTDRYSEVIPDTEIGYIYAAEEVMGLSERHENGFLFLQTGTLMYIDLKHPEAFGWRLALTTDEYLRLEKWMSENKDNGFDHTDYDAWKPVLDKLGIDYGDNIDTSSKQYIAAYNAVMGGEADFPPRGMTVEQAQEQIRYNMKQFDEDGDPVPFGSVPGMLVTEENDKERRTIIQIPDEVKQMMFELTKEEFIKWKGMGGDTQRTTVYRTYQEQAPKDDRLKGTWTLGQYEKIYNQFLVDTVKTADPDWQPGDDFDSNLLTGITRDQIDTYVYSEGSELIYDPNANF